MAKFVRWTGNDAKGEFSYIGEVIAKGKAGITLRTKEGEMFIPAGDGEVTAARAPRGFKATAKAAATKKAAAKAAAPKTKKAAAKAAPGERKARCERKARKIDVAVEIVTRLKAEGEPTRQDIIKAFMAEMGSTIGSASSMYHSAMKLVG